MIECNIYLEKQKFLVEITYDLEWYVTYLPLSLAIATNYTHIFVLNYVNSCQVQVMYSVQVEKDNITSTYNATKIVISLSLHITNSVK